MDQKSSRKNESKKNKKVLYVVIICIAIAILAMAIFNIVRIQAEEAKSRENIIKIQEVAQQTPQPTPEKTVEATPTPAPTKKPMDREIDFDGLQQQNSDIFAWIEIPGTEIDYPVLYSGDNTFYMTRDALKEDDVAGAIFMSEENNLGLEDPNTVLYGHNMKNGSMFAQLHKFEDKAFFDENKIVKVYTPDGQYNYEIFAAHKTDDRNILHGVDFTDGETFEQYLNDIQETRGLQDHLSETRPTRDDKILTLSTCVRGEDDKRYMVQAVLVEDE